MSPDTLKHCPICNLDLAIGGFGICRARKDGRNLYCKSCIRTKVTQSRRALEEYKAARKRVMRDQYWNQLNTSESEATPPIRAVQKLSPVDRVRNAIQTSARTYSEIRTETRLREDEIGDALANLLLWTHEIRTRVVDGTRIYEMNEVEEKPEPVYSENLSLADYLLKRGPAVVGEPKVRRVA